MAPPPPLLARQSQNFGPVHKSSKCSPPTLECQRDVAGFFLLENVTSLFACYARRPSTWMASSVRQWSSFVAETFGIPRWYRGAGDGHELIHRAFSPPDLLFATRPKDGRSNASNASNARMLSGEGGVWPLPYPPSPGSAKRLTRNSSTPQLWSPTLDRTYI